jgi:hypothetical protein
MMPVKAGKPVIVLDLGGVLADLELKGLFTSLSAKCGNHVEYE